MARALRCVAKIRRGDDARDAGIPPVETEASRLVRVPSTLIDDTNPQGQRMVKVGFWCWSAAALGAAACSVTPVRGRIDGVTSAETFTATARGSVVDKSGNLTFTTSHGVTCSGRFVYLTAQEVHGHLRLRRRARWSLRTYPNGRQTGWKQHNRQPAGLD